LLTYFQPDLDQGWGAGVSHLDPWTPEQRILAPFGLIYKGVFGTLLSLPWLASASQVPFGLALCMQGVGVWLAGSLQPRHMQPVFGFLNLHLNQIVRVQEPCLVARIEAGGVTTLFEW